jgi:cell division protein FtsZ
MQRIQRSENCARIRVVGIGDGGTSAVNELIAAGMGNVDFVTINTGAQTATSSAAPLHLSIDRSGSHAKGTGGDPLIGERAARESSVAIYKALRGSDMVFIIAGMGGGTGTGAAPVIAEIARKQGALTIGVVSLPFLFEGNQRVNTAERGIARLQASADTVIIVANNLLHRTVRPCPPALKQFAITDDLMRQGVQGITELVTVPGLINLDFADVRTIMSGGGSALMTVGQAQGHDRAVQAAEQAIHSQLTGMTIDGARGVLFNVTGGPEMTLHDVDRIANKIKERSHPDANLIFGAVVDEKMANQLRVTVIATGFESNSHPPSKHPKMNTVGYSWSSRLLLRRN